MTRGLLHSRFPMAIAYGSLSSRNPDECFSAWCASASVVATATMIAAVIASPRPEGGGSV